MYPCRLRREDCLVGPELAKRLALQSDSTMTSQPALRQSICDASQPQHPDAPGPNTTAAQQVDALYDAFVEERAPSRFELLLSTYPPVLESLLAQLPTRSVLDLYHTSHYLREFLRHYPLAWKTLSFRLPPPPAPNESPQANADRLSKAYGFESLLYNVLLPHATRLTSLDLCNTSVSGIALITHVVMPRIECLQHLSVRGCKSVSLKYHIVPFLEPYTVEGSGWRAKDIALKSLYTYRCRHHRRRPYLPSSLARRDSDADPTHQLVEICHKLGIWTDTAWCPTPAGRCQRRKEYHDQRGGTLNREIWVPFDRLWRSSNRLGPAEGGNRNDANDGRLWETSETGQDGEPLGTADGNGTCRGEGKQVPAHLRRSHTLFVEDVRCAQCNDPILERCESCSIRMHCMGCRKTLCESCAFNRPIPRKRAKTRHFASSYFGSNSTLGSALSQATGSTSSAFDTQLDEESDAPSFWWAPGATRSPNLMKESLTDDDSSDSDDAGNNLANGIPGIPGVRNIPKLNMKWCCVEPLISGGGGVNVVGSSSGVSGPGASRIRAVPLPPKKQYLDPDFTPTFTPSDLTKPSNPSSDTPFPFIRELRPNGTYEFYPVTDNDVDILALLSQEAADMDLQARNCPRSLCNECYRSWRWKITCRACKTPLCKEHDLRGLKWRRCGYREANVERDYVRTWREREKEGGLGMRLEIPAFRPKGGVGSGRTREQGERAVVEDGVVGAAEMANMQIPVPTLQQPTSQHNAAASSSSSSTPISGSSDNSTSSTNTTIMPFRPFATGPPAVGPSRPRSFSASGLRNSRSSHPTSLLAWSKASPNEPSLASSGTNFYNANSMSQSTGWLTSGALPGGPRHPVQFEGCGAFFCQYPRPMGDNRLSCPAEIRVCTDCAVVCCEVSYPYPYSSPFPLSLLMYPLDED